MERNKRPITDRFWEKVDIKGKDDCWEWKNSKNKQGYGQFMLSRNTLRRAHRLAWEFIFGPIPDGLYACHRCDNTSCCNPSHLFLGTATDNMHDCSVKGRIGFKVQPGETNGNHKYTESQIRIVKQRLASGIKGADIWRETNIPQDVISLIKKGQLWQSLV